MKKFFLTIIVVVFACMVNAADTPVTIQHNNTQPWEKNKGTLGRQSNEAVGPTYYYQRGDVIFGATWGTAHNNQMYSYERVDEFGNNISGWRYENGTFEFTSDYVWTDFASRFDGTDGNYGNIVEFGYYNIVDGQDAVTTHAVMSVVDGVDTINNSVIFEKGEKIGFYAKMQEQQKVETGHYVYEHKDSRGRIVATNDDPNGYTDRSGKYVANSGTAKWVVDSTSYETVTNTYTTTNDIEDATLFINNVDTNSRGEANQYFCLFKDQIDGQKHYEYYLAGAIASKEGQTYEDFIDEVIEHIENNGGDPSTITDSNGNAVGGQPLPGLLLSMVIGGTAVAGFSKKRKKA